MKDKKKRRTNACYMRIKGIMIHADLAEIFIFENRRMGLSCVELTLGGEVFRFTVGVIVNRIMVFSECLEKSIVTRYW